MPPPATERVPASSAEPDAESVTAMVARVRMTQIFLAFPWDIIPVEMRRRDLGYCAHVLAVTDLSRCAGPCSAAADNGQNLLLVIRGVRGSRKLTARVYNAGRLTSVHC